MRKNDFIKLKKGEPFRIDPFKDIVYMGIVDCEYGKCIELELVFSNGNRHPPLYVKIPKDQTKIKINEYEFENKKYSEKKLSLLYIGRDKKRKKAKKDVERDYSMKLNR